MLVVTWSVSSFCSGKKKKGEETVEMPATGSTSSCGKEADENVKPPVVPSSLVDEKGYVRNEADNEELRTLKYLEDFKPPQTLPYNVEEISVIEKAYERLHPELIYQLQEHKIQKYPKHKKIAKEEMRKKEAEEKKAKKSKEENDKKDKKKKMVVRSTTKTRTNTMTE